MGALRARVWYPVPLSARSIPGNIGQEKSTTGWKKFRKMLGMSPDKVIDNFRVLLFNKVPGTNVIPARTTPAPKVSVPGYCRHYWNLH